MLKLMVLFSPSKRDKTRLLLKNMDVMPGLGGGVGRVSEGGGNTISDFCAITEG